MQNVTDVDDPLLERAERDGVDWSQLAVQQTDLFAEDMAALNVLPPEHFVGAVESIPLVVELIQRLRERGAVYPVEDPDYPDLYFAQATDLEFGSLSKLLAAAARDVFAERGGDPDRPGKQAPLDCLVCGKTWRAGVGLVHGAGRAGLAHRVHRDRAGPARP